MKLKGKAKAAFLRRMAKGRNKKAGKKSAAPRKKRKTGGHHVAKKRRHRKHTKSSGKRRRSHASGLGKYVPPTDTLIGIGTAFAYGKLETAASTDQKHFLRSTPALVPQIGRAGNAGALLWLAGVVSKHPVVKKVAAGVLHVAAYQNGRAPANTFTKDAQDFKMSGRGGGGRGRDEMMVEEYLRRRNSSQP